MNYFGLFFTFGVGGILLGAMITAAVYEAKKKSRRRWRTEQAQLKKLYIANISQESGWRK